MDHEDDLLEEITRDHPEYAEYFATGGTGDMETDAGPVNPRLHVIIHSVVEKQIRGELPQANEALLRLTASGLSRHEAIHKLAEPLVREVYTLLTEPDKWDLKAYLKEIDKLGR